MFGKPSKKDLEKLCNLQKVTIKDLRIRLRNQKRNFYNQIDSFFQKYAEESKLSYVVIRGPNKIIALTPGFMKRFKFDEEIVGSNCYKILNNPSDELTQKDFEEVFSEHPEKIEKPAVIIDGEGNERYVHLTKEKPIQCEDEFYTRVQIYEIGKIEKIVGSSKRILGLNGEPKTLAGYVAREKAKQIKSDGESEKKKIMKEK